MSKHLIGRRVRLSLPDFRLANALAKVDTGAFHSSLHCVDIHKEDGKLWVLIDGARDYVVFDSYKISEVKSSNGQKERRYRVTTRVVLGDVDFDADFTLTDRSVMKLPILLGREALRGRFIVDVEYSPTSPNPEQKL